MKSPPHIAQGIYLPTEIVIQIVSFVASDNARRQQDLHACCLVSHQWYSAAVPLLYEKPRLDNGLTFSLFARTVCPPIKARPSKIKLGSLVRRLDMSWQVHESTHSLTARLLGRVKENLEVFIAPAAAFAINCLASLSKCSNLRYLDLYLVRESIPFTSLKKSLSNLEKLTTVRLPCYTSINVSDCANIKWPSNIQRLQLSGSFPIPSIDSFIWPDRLTSLTLRSCEDLSVGPMTSLLSSPQLGRSLKRLTVLENRGLQIASINAIPIFLPQLKFLSVPGGTVDNSFFEMLIEVSTPIALEVLEFGPSDSDDLDFSYWTLIDALDRGLANLRSVGFHVKWCTEDRIIEDERIEQALEARHRISATNGHAAAETDADTDVGVYYT
ncbi:F-box domain protein [Paecilomyces variotii No. 5]|uniref:F-box domain protein n=1 Tax=Byssochlamys spectabilis (strain No. 5 / NBRC 109023) TaxID=1356009 RepID=V5F892_BYSSN|nr:F-box domain protein [Paecilomyces variotii No. 5]